MYEPRSHDEIYSSLKGRLTGKIDKLTNFTPSSFNYIWVHDGFAGYMREYEVALLAAQLSAFPEYVGGPITDDDLNHLNIENVRPDELNKYMDDSNLDEKAKEVGVTRDPGQTATGQVTFQTTNDGVVISKGTEVATDPDADGDYYSYYTTEEVTPSSGSTSVTAPIEAETVGNEYNTGSGQITYLPSAPSGIESVTNNTEVDGGEDEESNAEFRQRMMNALENKSQGGTVSGIEGYVMSNVDGVEDVNVDEKPTASPPQADVVVHGGSSSAVQDAIDASHPSGVKHNLVWASKYAIKVDVTVSGGDIDQSAIRDNIRDYIAELELNEDVIRDKVTYRVIDADDDITDITSLSIEIEEETHTFDSTVNVYGLDKVMENDGISAPVTDASGDSFSEDVDFTEADNDGDGQDDSIDWSLSGSTPADGEDFYVTYRVPKDVAIGKGEIATSGSIYVSEA